jgi:MYXO-CTERM domain-containing protein
MGCGILARAVRLLSIAFLFTVASLTASVASAQCPVGAAGCFDDEVMFMWSDRLFDTIDLDSGWVPSGSPLQIRLGFHLAGETQIDMMGTTYAFWQPALSIMPIGMAGGGRVSVDYGLEIVARIRFDVEVAGIRYTWEGDIPLPGSIPRDLRLANETFFDPFVLPNADPRPVTLSDTTETIDALTVGLPSIRVLGVSIGGGFRLGLYGRLDAAYEGDRIDIVRREVPGNPALAITEHEGAAIVPAPSATGYGASEDVAVDPVGRITYAGSLVAEPTLFIEILGRRFDLTVATIPIPIVDEESSPDFLPEEIHIPLPDVVVEDDRLEFGVVEVGERVEMNVRFRNEGEAELRITPRTPDAPFDVATDVIVLAPRGERQVVVGFAPIRDGAVNQLLAFDTNDPDRPLVTIRATGEGFEVPMADAGPMTRDGGTMSAPGISGGACGCSAVGASGARTPLLGLLLLLGVVVLRRRG